MESQNTERAAGKRGDIPWTEIWNISIPNWAIPEKTALEQSFTPSLLPFQFHLHFIVEICPGAAKSIRF